MNRFGTLFHLAIFGESHGAGVGILIDGMPAGLPLAEEDLLPDLARRRAGAVGTTPRVERDLPQIKSGILDGHTTGAPILIWFDNTDTRSKDYSELKLKPRPGHADWTAQHKFGGFNDYRGGGHFSGRLTVGIVAAGVIAKKLIAPARVEATLTQAGGEQDASAAASAAADEHDSIGGIIECRASQLPAGLGEPFWGSAESLLAHAAFAIPGIKGIEFGAGFACAQMRGSTFNDPIAHADGTTTSNHSGGVNGGITNGNELVYRVAVRPPASIGLEQQTVDLSSGRPATLTVEGRHDACIALRIPPVLEAMTAIVLADLMMQAGLIPRVWDARA